MSEVLRCYTRATPYDCLQKAVAATGKHWLALPGDDQVLGTSARSLPFPSQKPTKAGEQPDGIPAALCPGTGSFHCSGQDITPFHLSVLTITTILEKRIINLIRDVCNDKQYQMLQHPLPLTL